MLTRRMKMYNVSDPHDKITLIAPEIQQKLRSSSGLIRSSQPT